MNNRQEQQLIARNTELEKELALKNRELEIEAALDRLRSRMLRMQKSSELEETTAVMYQQMDALGIVPEGSMVYIVIIDTNTDTAIQWIVTDRTLVRPQEGELRTPLTEDPRLIKTYAAWKRKDPLLIRDLSGDELEDFKNYIKSLPSFQEVKSEVDQWPDRLVWSEASFSNGTLGFICPTPLPAATLDILVRFSKDFDLTYTRFLDLQKAEAQARQAQIEAALERTRTQSMLMEHSNELDVTSQIFHEQLLLLGIPSEFSYVWLPDESKNEHQFWATWQETEDTSTVLKSKAVIYPLDKTEPYTAACFVAWESDEPVHQHPIPPEEVDHFFATWPELIDGVNTMKSELFPDGLYYAEAYMKYGCFGINVRRLLSEEEQSILRRFSTEFERTYTRFLDLKKAEAQAREAQIEAALERVRSRTMGMQKSEELKEVIQVVYEQFIHLNIHIEHTGFIMDYKARDDMHIWLADKNEIPAEVTFPYFDCAHWNSFIEAKEKGINFFANHLPFEEKNKFYQDLFNLIPGVPEESLEYYFSAPGLAISTVLLENVGLYIENFSAIPYTDEENNTLMRFGKVFQQTYTRFLDLQKAEAQAKEAQIEASLERVRSKTMGMQRSDELQNTAMLLFQQVEALGVPVFGCGFNIWDNDRKAATAWMAGKDRLQPPFKTSSSEDIFLRIYEAAERGESLFVEEQNDDALKTHYEYMASIPVFKEIADKMAKAGQSFPTFQIMHCAYFSQGYLMFITSEPASNAYDIFKRFAKVFKQTYTRFLDLQKAEEQAREAQIEAALEKVRSRSIGMQNSKELREVIQVIHDQLIHLNIEIDAAGFTLDYHQNNDWNTWIANKSGSLPSLMFIPYIDHAQFNYYKSAKEKGLDFLANTLSFAEKNSIFNYMFGFMGDYPQAEKDELLSKPGLAISQAFLKNISLWIYNLDAIPYSAEVNSILMRFAKVFEQTYVRFNDLKQAEAQAREAQIEAALEKVRSRSMAMHKSEELAELSFELVKQVQALGVATWFCAFNIYDEDQKGSLEWGSNAEGTYPNYRTPREGIFLRYYEAGQRGETLLINEIGENECGAHYDYLCSLPGVGEQLLKMKDAGIPFPTSQIDHVAFFKYGYIIFITYEPVPEAHDIFIRFAKVFEQTYTRFLDLQKAEALTRETQIELSLERIRAQVTAMHESTDLLDIVVSMHAEFTKLGHEAHYFWHMHWRPNTYEKAMTSGDGSRIGMVMELPRGFHELEAMIAWEANDEPSAVFALDADTAADYIEKMIKLGSFKEVDHNTPGPEDVRALGGLTFIMARTTHGEIGYSLPGVVPDPPLEDIATLVRFAGVFDLAYKRFEDLQLSEKRTRETQIELSLEKVRSRTMAMQHSDELPEAANLLFLEVQVMGIPAWSAGYNILAEDKKSSTCIMSSEGEIQVPFVLPLTEHSSLLPWYEAIKNDLDFFVYEQGGDDLLEHYNYMATVPGLEEVFQQFKDAGISLPTHQFNHLARFNNGFLLFITYESVPEAHDIFKRFSKVFEQTYTRFLDLELKEEQAVKLEQEKQRLEKTLGELQTTQKQLIQSEKMASLGELTAGIAHEIQNPLNFVNNFSEVSSELVQEAKEEIEKGEMKEAIEILSDLTQNLEKITHHGVRASSIVKGMLDHSRSSSGEKELIDINALCDEYLRLAYHGMRAKDKRFNASFETNFDERLPKVNIIPQDIGRVVLNIINNAFHAVDEKAKGQDLMAANEYKALVMVSTRVHPPIPTSGGQGFIEININDNGSGIPDNIKDKIFQPFFTTKPTGQGTGLGLSLSYDIVKAHGGEIELDSSYGKGTKFIIFLPLTQ